MMDECFLVVISISLEMVLFNMGLMNFGIFLMFWKYYDFQFDWEWLFLEMMEDFIFLNIIKIICYVIEKFQGDYGIKFEFECYDLGYFYMVKWFVDQGLIKLLFFVQMVFGIFGGMGVDIDNFLYFYKKVEVLFGVENYEWLVLVVGCYQMLFVIQSVFFGGNLCVGLEDSFFIGKCELVIFNV